MSDTHSDYADFDGAKARVSNGVLYVTWTAPTTKRANMTITPLAQIHQVDWTEGEPCLVFYLGSNSHFVYCKKARELAEFIGKHLGQYYENEWRQYFPGHARGIAVHG